ncbi:MAG: HEAT repeat domain-containing protein [Planctomycetota bacterium]
MLRVGNSEAAIAKLKEIIQSDPSNEDAHELYRSVSQDEWFLLMTQEGEIQKIARSILERAKVTRRERSRDMDAIGDLVSTATDNTNDYGTRQAAINKLIGEHGEFAVPALVEKIGNPDDVDSQIHAISVLSQLHVTAVLPLIEVLKSDNELMVQNAAATLLMIGDNRAQPMMAHLANDDRANIRTIAEKFLAKTGAKGDALTLMTRQTVEYLKGNVPTGGYSDVVWKLKDGALVATDVPQILYPTELAKAVAEDAVRIAPSSKDARSWLAAANLAQAQLIETSIASGDETTAELGPVAQELKVAALATGTDALRGALDAGVRGGMAPVAIGAIHALAGAEVIDSIGESSLLAALNSGDKRIKYAAADAIVAASRGGNIPQAAKVVDVLAQAVTEEKVNMIHVIAPGSDAQGAVEVAKSERGMGVLRDASALSGMSTLLSNPSIDVVVINEVLPDRLPEDIIGNLKKDPRLADMKIVIVTKDEEAATERFGDEVGYIAGPLTSENLQAAVATALEGVEDRAGARAEGFASKASAALLNLAGRKANIGGALSNLAMQLNRGDSVAVPAAKAIGLSGGAGQLTALVGALENGSEDLKTAAAHAMGGVLSRMSSCPEEVCAALMGAMDSAEGGLRMAIATAFGKAKIDASKKLELLQKLSRVAGSSDEG